MGLVYKTRMAVCLLLSLSHLAVKWVIWINSSIWILMQHCPPLYYTIPNFIRNSTFWRENYSCSKASKTLHKGVYGKLTNGCMKVFELMLSLNKCIVNKTACKLVAKPWISEWGKGLILFLGGKSFTLNSCLYVAVDFNLVYIVSSLLNGLKQEFLSYHFGYQTMICLSSVMSGIQHRTFFPQQA